MGVALLMKIFIDESGKFKVSRSSDIKPIFEPLVAIFLNDKVYAELFNLYSTNDKEALRKKIKEKF